MNIIIYEKGENAKNKIFQNKFRVLLIFDIYINIIYLYKLIIN